MRVAALAVAGFIGALTLNACGSKTDATAGATDSTQPQGGNQSIAASAISALSAPASVAAPSCQTYRSDLSDADMVMISYAAGKIDPPIDHWAEQDPIMYGAQADETQWKAAKQKVQAQYAAVAQERCFTIKTGSQVSAYDPANKQFTLKAFDPGIYYRFEGLREEVRVQVANGDEATKWPVPPDQADAMSHIPNGWPNVQLTAYVHVTGAHPDTGHNVISVVVDRYDVSNGSGQKIATVEVGHGG